MIFLHSDTTLERKNVTIKNRKIVTNFIFSHFETLQNRKQSGHSPTCMIHTAHLKIEVGEIWEKEKNKTIFTS